MLWPDLYEGGSLAGEHLYRLLSDNPSDVIYRSSADRKAVWISPSVTALSGWSQEELVGTIIDELAHPDDWAALQETRRELREGTNVPEAASGLAPPIRIRMKSGEYRWMSTIGVPFIDSDGKPAGIVGRLRDVDELVRARQLAEADEARLQATLDGLLDPLVVLEPVRDQSGTVIDFICLEANPAACTFIGRDRDDALGLSAIALLRDHGASAVMGMLTSVADTGEPMVIDDLGTDRIPGSDERSWFDMRMVRSGTAVVYTWRDRTARHEFEQAVADSEELYRLVTDDVTDAVVRNDDQLIVTWVSPSFERLTGYSAESIVGRSALELLPADQVAEASGLGTRRSAGAANGETRIQLVRADGARRWITTASRPFIRRDGTADGYVTVVRDVQDEVEAKDRLAHEIGHDPLTGLANRELAISRINRSLDDLSGSRRVIALLCAGVDRLSTVNQALTYAGGDEVLMIVATRIAAAVGNPDLVARVAGDEFVVLMPDLDNGIDAAAMAARLCEAVRGPITIGDHVIEPTISIGIATGDHEAISEELLRQASLAVRQAKDAGRDTWQFIDPRLAEQAQRRLSVEAQLREALRAVRIVPWFQPIVTLDDRTVRGYEALARWTESDGRVRYPDEFLPTAERSALIVDIDFAILKQALGMLALSPVEHMSVNVSAPSLASDDFADRCAAVLGSSGVAPSRLRLEVTETALLHMSADIAEKMQYLDDLGASWYVDDFGTGYSSISHLRDLPIRGLKLDQSFTSGVRNGDARSVKVAQGLMGLADGLGLDTVAEGVETQAEAAVLQAQGWRQGQGWLFGRAEALQLVHA